MSDARVAIVTGSSRGIRRTIALKTVQDGHNIPQFSLYCTSRGAAEQMVILAKDLGRKGITVNSMNPEPTHTDAFHDGKTGEQALNGQILRVNGGMTV
ncbi:hypothetical protein BG003_010673 [Podila horticola]|nr:hypothetical protein BG003_010673 [Podila horticola]